MTSCGFRLWPTPVNINVLNTKNLDRRGDSVLLGAMKPAGQCKLVLVTAPDLKTARALAGEALKARLAACANLLPGIESRYWWQGKIERSKEVLLVMKTTAACLPGLEKLIMARHPSDTPEFIALNLNEGNRRYLAWLAASCRTRQPAAYPDGRVAQTPNAAGGKKA